MPAVEYPMWVHKRTLIFDKLGFQMVPRALRQQLIDAGAASDTFDQTLALDHTPPPEPPEVPAAATLRRSRR